MSAPSGRARRPRTSLWLWLWLWLVAVAEGAENDSTSCPASAEVRRAHATPVLAVGARPWAMGPLPAKPLPAPEVNLATVHAGHHAGDTTEAIRHLLRRMTFVLSGLPPREDDAETFLANPSPRSLEKALDRLLGAATATQRLTEAWLRAAGHADRWPEAEGSRVGSDVEAWRYRDWVVTTLRTTPDLRRLARLTLAGDTQPKMNAVVSSRPGGLATLWHVTTTPITDDYENTVMGWSERQAERSAQAFLGLDLTCARCHDHPALPLPSEEAAGLVAIFAHSHAFVRGPDGKPVLNRVSTATPAVREKRERALAQVAAEEAKLDELRRAFALVATAEFLPQTAEYVRAAWAWHRQPGGTLASFSATRGLLEEPLQRWLSVLGLAGEPPPHSLSASWWAEWTAARDMGTPQAIAAAARTLQDVHRADAESPFFSTSPAMDAFFTLDQQTQVARHAEKISALRRRVPDDPQVPTVSEGPPPGLEPPALAPSLPTLLTGGPASLAITPPEAGRRALATWLEGEGSTFFARLAAVRLAEGLGHPLLPAPSALHLWASDRPPGAEAVDDVAACLQSGGWPAAAKRLLLRQASDPVRPPLTLGGSEWRDAVLFVTGTLDPRQGGPPDIASDSPRRSLYREWAPLPAPPTQDFLDAQAATLASLVRRKAGTDPKVQLHFLTFRLFQRAPTPDEIDALSAQTSDLPALCADLLRSEEFRTLP